MRLSPQQLAGIITALDTFMVGIVGELRLYGSRTRDDLKGGDIDLLLIVQANTAAADLQFNKHKLLAEIKKHIGDQKIDLTIILPAQIEQDPFLKNIFSQSLLLHNWQNSKAI